MSNSRMRAPALAGVATVRGARGAPGPTLIRARGTMNEPTSMPTPRAILAEVSSDVGRAVTVGNSYGGLGDQALFRSPRCEWHPGRITVLSAVGVSRRMMVSEALAS